jgi:hypothetical protein
LQNNVEKILNAKRLLKLMKSGSSLPSLVETEAENYIIKWNGSGEGTTASAVDWITTRLARSFDIPTATPALINVKPDFLEQTKYDEMRDIISGSFGVNLGIQFISDATSYTARDAERLEHPLKTFVFLFDVLVLNTDRTTENPNILLAKGQPYFIDFSAAFEVRSAITNHQVQETMLLSILREHPFYSENIDATDFSRPQQAIEEIVMSVPNAWLPEDANKQKMAERLKTLFMRSTEILPRRLAILRDLPVPDPEAKRLRMLENRKRLGL